MKLHNSLMSQGLLYAENTNQALAMMRHDEIHHLRTLSQYISEDVDKARDYVGTLTQSLEQNPTMRFTKNKLVNSIFSVQSANAVEKGVGFVAKANIPENLSLPAQDLTTVLMILLDNAVSAATKANREKTTPSVSSTLAFRRYSAPNILITGAILLVKKPCGK